MLLGKSGEFSFLLDWNGVVSALCFPGVCFARVLGRRRSGLEGRGMERAEYMKHRRWI